VWHYLVDWSPTLKPEHLLLKEAVDKFEAQLREQRRAKNWRGRPVLNRNEQAVHIAKRPYLPIDPGILATDSSAETLADAAVSHESRSVTVSGKATLIDTRRGRDGT
jgi:hypothetical protein